MAHLNSRSFKIAMVACAAVLLFFNWYVNARALSTFAVVQGGTGSTTLSGILKGNGTSQVGTAVIGSNLTWDGTTLSATGGSGSPGGSNTQIQYNSTGSFAGSANLVWDNGNTRLGVGTNTPVATLHVYGAGTGSAGPGNANIPFAIQDPSGGAGHNYFAFTTRLAEDSLGISDMFAGVTRLFIDPSGNIGLGTTSPYARLSVHANNGGTNTTLFAVASSTASATTTLFSINNIGNVIAAGTLQTSGGITSGGDLSVSAAGTSPTTPRVLGITDLNPGTAARIQFGDNVNNIQTSWGGRTEWQSYWGLEIHGSRQSGTPVSFAVGASTDPNLNIINDANAAVVTLALTENSLQTANIQEWRNSSGGALDVVDSSGKVGVGTSTPATLMQLFSTGTSTLSIDSNSSSKGACIEMKDYSGGGYTYLYTKAGVLFTSTISCK